MDKQQIEEFKDSTLKTLKKLQEDNKIQDDKFQKGYYLGFEDGCNAIINEALSQPKDDKGLEELKTEIENIITKHTYVDDSGDRIINGREAAADEIIARLQPQTKESDSEDTDECWNSLMLDIVKFKKEVEYGNIPSKDVQTILKNKYNLIFKSQTTIK